MNDPFPELGVGAEKRHGGKEPEGAFRRKRDRFQLDHGRLHDDFTVWMRLVAPGV